MAANVVLPAWGANGAPPNPLAGFEGLRDHFEGRKQKKGKERGK